MTSKTNNQVDVEKSSSNLEPEATHLERPTINLGNEAVLLDVTAGHIDGALLGTLKLAKDGHVRAIFSLQGKLNRVDILPDGPDSAAVGRSK
jgi:hypothetical protein